MKERSHLQHKGTRPAQHCETWPGRQSRSAASPVYFLRRDSGTIQRINTDNASLALRRGRRKIPVVFHWSDASHFQEKGKTISPEELKQGEQVNILYIKEGSRRLAQAVLVRHQPKAIPEDRGSERNPD